jgi:acyl-CoA reductase-like NAD-dependent aldehyde dehydrogenase
VKEAIESGGHIEGARLSDYLYQPTSILEPSAAAGVSKEEVFGPVTCIYGYTEFDAAISRANSLPFAFQA